MTASKSRQVWLVLDMDEGVIRREPSRRQAVAWILSHIGGKVLRRHSYGPGAYEYSIGANAEACAGCFVERLDVAMANGWGDWFQIPDLYPDPERPHRTDLDVDRDLLIEQMRTRP
jgi:hypothetical protein